MAGYINLHPKHGLNPSIAVCQFCGRDTGEIALLGAKSKKLTGQEEAPHRLVVNPWPCDECSAEWASTGGVVLLECREEDGKPLPTGRVVVLTEDAVRRIFDSKAAEAAIKHHKALIEPAAFQRLFGNLKDTERKK